MSDPTNTDAVPNIIDKAGTRAVLTVADQVLELRAAATTLQANFDTRSRGYFTPSEDEEVGHLWISYHSGRAALLEIVNSIRTDVGQPSRETVAEFALAYAAALVLVDAAQSLRQLFGKNELVRRKLNEAFDEFRIPAGNFDQIQLSLTDPGNALHIRNANQFFEENQKLLWDLANNSSELASILKLIDTKRAATDIGTTRYLKARARELGREARDRLVIGNAYRAIYAIQELGSRVVSHLSTNPNHVPTIPKPIGEQILSVLRPGDVMITRKEHAITNYFLPGYWPHAAMYVGGQRVVESLKDGVMERDIISPFSNDAISVIRPQLDAETIKIAIERAHSHVGKPYDFDFDFTRADRMVCTEVVYRSYEGLGKMHFELTRRAGRKTLSAEDLLKLAIANKSFRTIAAYSNTLTPQLLHGKPVDELLRNTISDH